MASLSLSALGCCNSSSASLSLQVGHDLLPPDPRSEILTYPESRRACIQVQMLSKQYLAGAQRLVIVGNLCSLIVKPVSESMYSSACSYRQAADLYPFSMCAQPVQRWCCSLLAWRTTPSP